MEWLDGRLAGVPITRLSDAFGGSILLGAGITVLCAALGACLAYVIARWLLSHRDAIAAIIATLVSRHRGDVRRRTQDIAFKALDAEAAAQPSRILSL